MIDVIYCLGTGSKWSNNEILYSLRSLEKYGKNIGKVYLSGIKPRFINNNIIWIKEEDRGFPSYSQWNKIKNFFNKTQVNKAIYMMDDIFFTKEIDLENYPYYQKGNLKDIKDSKTTYNKSLINTFNELKEIGKSTINFEVHCPIIFEKNKFLEFTDRFNNYHKKYPQFIQQRSFYCNYYNIDGVYTKDVKIKREHINNLNEKTNILDCFSISDEVIYCGISKLLQEKFPNKSKYEK